MADGKWKRIGVVIAFNTKRDGTRKVTKNGVEFYQGFGDLNGQRVSITLMPGREGMMDVIIEAPPADEEA